MLHPDPFSWSPVGHVVVSCQTLTIKLFATPAMTRFVEGQGPVARTHTHRYVKPTVTRGQRV